MIEPILSLAFSMQSSKGVYALLLGSGVSRAAGIPTGWDIVLDLIRKVAAIKGLDCEPDPAVWYKDAFGEDPDYSKLLDDIAKTPAERNQLLRSYFEPTEADREACLKIPTESHKAIAQLVVGGFIKIIITTNFDKLLEEALHSVGIVPTVISTPDAVDGALPLMHSTCTVIKINGDYLDVRIKNTPKELADYDERMNALLDRVLDEFGLIICGWSAVWDTALRAAVERCKNHRFTTFWTTRAELGEVPKKLVELRRARTITILNADGFFKELTEKVSALEEYSRPHPLSVKAAVVSLKKYIADDKYKVSLYDLSMKETEKLYSELFTDKFSLHEPFNSGTLVKRLNQYEALSEILLSLIVNGCFHGKESNNALWVRCIERIANPPQWNSGLDVWINLRLYPALLLTYGGCIASIAANKYSTFSAVLTKATVKDGRDEKPLILKVNSAKVLRPDFAKILPRKETRYTPFSDYLVDYFREPLKDFLPQEDRYIKSFDRFEYLSALIFADILLRTEERVWGPIGAFGWRRREIRTEVESEIEAQGSKWPPLHDGLFESSVERLKDVKSQYDALIDRLGWW